MEPIHVFDVLGKACPLFEGGLDNSDNDGEFSDTDFCINVTDASNIKVVLHELAHAIVARSGLNEILSHDAEEILATAIANVLGENGNYAYMTDHGDSCYESDL